jgi:hypothetical protein
MLLGNIFTAAALAATAFAAPSEKRQSRKLKWFGINESGAEFGEKNFTGIYGKEYIWYDLKTIDVSSTLQTRAGSPTVPDDANRYYITEIHRGGNEYVPSKLPYGALDTEQVGCAI